MKQILVFTVNFADKRKQWTDENYRQLVMDMDSEIPETYQKEFRVEDDGLVFREGDLTMKVDRKESIRFIEKPLRMIVISEDECLKIAEYCIKRIIKTERYIFEYIRMEYLQLNANFTIRELMK